MVGEGGWMNGTKTGQGQVMGLTVLSCKSPSQQQGAEWPQQRLNDRSLHSHAIPCFYASCSWPPVSMLARVRLGLNCFRCALPIFAIQQSLILCALLLYSQVPVTTTFIARFLGFLANHHYFLLLIPIFGSSFCPSTFWIIIRICALYHSYSLFVCFRTFLWNSLLAVVL